MVLKQRSGKSRKTAFEHYQPICVWCGVSISDLLEVAHLDHDRSNDDPKNLVFLCSTHHRMLDLGLIPSEVVAQLRDRPLKPDWSILIKGGKKTSKTSQSVSQKPIISKIQTESKIEKIMIRRSEAALKAWATRGAENPKKFGEPTKQDIISLEKMKKGKKETKIKNHSKEFKIKRKLAAYKAQLTRRQKNPKKYGKVTKELLENIKRLEQK